MFKKFENFVSDEQGQGMTEYGLILAFVALAIILALGLFGDGVRNMYININNQLNW